MDEDKKLNDNLDEFLNDNIEEGEVCKDETCIIPTKKDGLIERVNKRMITDDGRELLV